ncbi:MAG: antibiotic biosynthesis monooxygenase [Thermomicrobia bacterium]|nr:antibiotic biosynthesis monooxygenase [Thermomicrobia bacterium]MCA1723685.1 antibiotic biosynthesis monooxygenase [Thermomicrobia bacterium]
MHARVAYYQFKPGKGEEAAKKAEAGILPIYRKHAGFHSYEVVLTGGDTGYSVSTWDTEGQATEAVKAAETWVKENIADLIASAQNHVGVVAFSHRANQ